MPGPSPREELFHNPQFDSGAFASSMEKKEAPRTFGIIFTPRSGSSWLTDVLSQTRLLGKPQEWFNPNFVPNITRAVNAKDLDSYLKMLRRKHKPGGFFSFEVTIYQMLRVFGSERNFLARFPETTPLFYLTREDMVLQAISLSKAVRTSVFHSPNASDDEIDKADTEFSYDAAEIKRWLDHVFDQEKKCEAFFSAAGLHPHRMSYEQVTADGAEATVRRFLRVLKPEKATELVIPDLEPKHRKIASSRNGDYATRFREEHPEKIAEIEAFRADLPALDT
ncbi:Stf0 family sulfotransferase [Aquicoccus sp.]|uniref:Stf0 family sulfotransferase n=1 Tax=Aquicoccus sp. TaxID=2055851 RepID=UPI003567692D